MTAWTHAFTEGFRMSQRYNSQSGNPDDAESARLEQDELMRQLRTPPAGSTAGAPAASKPGDTSVDPSKFTEGYQQRGGGGGGVASGAVSGGLTGASIGNVVPGIGTAIGAGVGALVGGIKGAFSREAESAKTDYSVNDARSALTEAFRTYNGHDPKPGEVDEMLRGQGLKPGDRYVGSGGLNSVINSLRSNAQAASASQASQTPAAPTTAPAGGPAAPVDSSQWDTDGFAKPGYVAANAGKAPAGFDPDKWNNPNHQSPKYVFGRILNEASGGTGVLRDPAQREQAVGNILKAYPGATFDGKQKIKMPDGAIIDIFHGADAGHYGVAFQVEPGTGRDPNGNLLPAEGGARSGGGDTGGIKSLVPTDTDYYNQLQAKLAEILGGPQQFDREALLQKIGVR